MTPTQWNDLIKSVVLIALTAVVTFFASRVNLFAQMEKQQQFEREKLTDQRNEDRLKAKLHSLAAMRAHTTMISLAIGTVTEYQHMLDVRNYVRALSLELLTHAQQLGEVDIWKAAVEFVRLTNILGTEKQQIYDQAILLNRLCADCHDALA